MKSITNSAIVEKIKGTGRTFTISIKVGNNTFSTVKSLKQSTIFASGQKLSVGETVSSFIEAEINDCKQSLANYEIEPTLYIDGYGIPLGIFKVEAPSNADGSGTQKITAYDRMSETSKYTYKATGLTSAKSTFSAICTTCGYIAITTGLTDATIDDSKLDGLTCREALGLVAGVLGKNCIVTTDGKFKMVGYSTVSESTCKISIDSLDTLDFPSQASTIDYFNVVVDDETAYKSGTGNSGLNLVNRLFTSITQTSSILTALKSSVGGDGYYPAKFKQLNGDPRIECGDVIKVEHRDILTGVVTADYVPVMSLILDYDGGVTVSIEAYPPETEFLMSLSDKIDFSNASNDKKFEDVNNKIDESVREAGNFIEVKTNAVAELNKVISNSLGLYQTQIEGTGGDIKYYFHNKPTLASSTYIVTMTDSGFASTNSWNNGNPSWTYGITKDGNAIFNYLVAEKISANLIEAGVIKSLDNAPIKTELSLNTGLMSMISDAKKEVFGFGVNRFDHLLLQYNYSDSSKKGIKLGHYYSGVFYKDAKHTEIISPSADFYYGDLVSGNFYEYSSSKYIQVTDLTDVVKTQKGFIMHPCGGTIGYTVGANGVVQSDFNFNMEYSGGNLGLIDSIEDNPSERTPILKFYDFENEAVNGSSNYTAIRKQSITTRDFGARNISLQFDGKFIDLAWLLNSFLSTFNSYKTETDEALSSNQSQMITLNTKLTDYQNTTNASLASNQDRINTLGLDFDAYQAETDALLTAYQAQINSLNAEIVSLKNFLGTQNLVVNVYANPSEGGTITGGGIYSLSDGTVYIRVSAYSDYIISRVEINRFGFTTTYEGDDFSDPTDFKFQHNISSQDLGGTIYVYAYFEKTQPQEYNISVSASPSGSGYVTGGGAYENGATATLTAIPYTGYAFKQWSDGDTSNPRNVIATSNKTYTAVFEAVQNKCTLTLIADPSSGGTVSGGGTYDYETNVKIVATPNSGYDFAGWYYSDGTLFKANTTTDIKLESNVTLTAKFKANGGGSVGSNEVRLITTVARGEAVNCCVCEADGYILGTDVTVGADSGAYVACLGADGWVIDYLEIYRNGTYEATITSAMMGSSLMGEGRHHFWQPAIDNSDGGSTFEFKYYLKQA